MGFLTYVSLLYCACLRVVLICALYIYICSICSIRPKSKDFTVCLFIELESKLNIHVP